MDRLELARKLMLGHGKGLTLTQIATELGVSTRTARRYLQRLDQTEFELERLPSRTENLKWRIKSPDRPRKIGLRRAQVFALLATRHAFEPMKGSALYDEIQLAMRELMTIANRPGRGPNASIVDTVLEDRFVYLPASPANYRTCTESIDVFYHAVAGLHPVRCTHHRDDGSQQPVVLHPYSLVMYRDAIIVVAAVVATTHVASRSPNPRNTDPVPHSGSASQTLLTFALHELRDAKLDESTTFSLPAKFNLKHLYQGHFGLRTVTHPVRIVVDFDQTAAVFIKNRQIHPSQRISQLRSGGLRLTFRTDITTALIQWIHAFGPHARVIEPARLRTRVIEELRRSLAQYRSTDAGDASNDNKSDNES